MPSEELEDNAGNWRTHPFVQRQAITELLDQVGIAGVLTAYHSERNDGKLTLIDGHERKSHQAEWPVAILDVNDDEADLLLLALDPLAGMATSSPDDLEALLRRRTRARRRWRISSRRSAARSTPRTRRT